MQSSNEKKKRGLSGRMAVTLALVALAILAVGAGAAVGNSMRGELDAKIPITVSQALVAEKPLPYNFPPARKFFGSVSDDKTRFSFAMELYRGESLTVLVPIVNQSSGDTVAEFSVTIPDIPSLIEGSPGLVLEVSGSGQVDDVVRLAPDSWVFTAKAGINGVNANPNDGLLLTFKVAPTAMAGFFEITGLVRTVEF